MYRLRDPVGRARLVWRRDRSNGNEVREDHRRADMSDHTRRLDSQRPRARQLPSPEVIEMRRDVKMAFIVCIVLIILFALVGWFGYGE